MKTAKILCWVRTPSDSRDTAGSTASAKIPQKDALEIARAIDIHGDRGAGGYLPLFRLPEGHHLATGHGTSVIYASGQKRHVRS